MARYSNGESVFSRFARLLETVGQDGPAITVTELSDRTGLSLPAVSRMVSELVEHGWLQRDAQRRVSIGLPMWEMVSRAVPTREICDTVMPFMTELHTRVGHTAYLSVRYQREVLFLRRLTRPDAVRTVVGSGSRLPLHASAPGLVLLAHAPKQLQEQIIEGPLPAYTPYTLNNAHAVRTRLTEIRRVGVAYCPGAIDVETTAIAVPLRTATGQVTAALSVVVPNDDRARGMLPILQATALRINHAIAERNISAAPIVEYPMDAQHLANMATA